MATDDNCEQEDATDVYDNEVVKATVSEAVGTLIWPLTSLGAKHIQAWVDNAEAYINDLKKKKREENLKKINSEFGQYIEVPDDTDEGAKITKAIEYSEAINDAADQDLSDDLVFELWKEVFTGIQRNDPITQIYKDTIQSLGPDEILYIQSQSDRLSRRDKLIGRTSVGVLQPLLKSAEKKLIEKNIFRYTYIRTWMVAIILFITGPATIVILPDSSGYIEQVSSILSSKTSQFFTALFFSTFLFIFLCFYTGYFRPMIVPTKLGEKILRASNRTSSQNKDFKEI